MALTAERLRELLHYDPETGVFMWRSDRKGGALAGDAAGGIDRDGYVVTKIDQRSYFNHRLAFLYMTGEWPADQVDHINRVPNDNRWINLRRASQAQNGANKGATSRSVTGIKGVSFHQGSYEARIRAHGKSYYLGRFATAEEAAAAYAKAANDLHGEFARTA